MEELKYPIGCYQAKKEATPRDVAKWINEIQALPENLRSAVSDLHDDQLDTPYRDNGWTIRQIVHHIADSHLNGYVRTKLALTEERPTVKPYEQDDWAGLPDSSLPVDVSLDLISGLHARWCHLLKLLGEEELNREFIHPESGTLVLSSLIGLYAWHGKHHLAHITNLKARKNWS